MRFSPRVATVQIQLSPPAIYGPRPRARVEVQTRCGIRLQSYIRPAYRASDEALAAALAYVFGMADVVGACEFLLALWALQHHSNLGFAGSSSFAPSGASAAAPMPGGSASSAFTPYRRQTLEQHAPCRRARTRRHVARHDTRQIRRARRGCRVLLKGLIQSHRSRDSG